MTTLQADIDWSKYMGAVRTSQSILQEGSIVKVSGMVAEANGPGLGVGSLCTIRNADGDDIDAEVVGFRDNRVVIMPLGELRGVKPGSRVMYKTILWTVRGPFFPMRTIRFTADNLIPWNAASSTKYWMWVFVPSTP